MELETPMSWAVFWRWETWGLGWGPLWENQARDGGWVSDFILVLRHSCANQDFRSIFETFYTQLLKQTNPVYTQFSLNGISSNSDIYTACQAFLLFEILGCFLSNPWPTASFYLIVYTPTLTLTLIHTQHLVLNI